MRKAKWTIALTLALIVAMSAAAFAQAPPPPLQTPLNPLKIPQFVEALPTLNVDAKGNPIIPVAGGPALDISLCEFMTNILPAGTLGKGSPAPKTWVFGYQEGNGCAPNFNQNGVPIVQPRTYLGPAVVAVRGTPTTMNFYNKLPDASKSQVLAYKYSVDQTVIWGDPLSLNSAATVAPFGKIDGAVVPWAQTQPYPEDNECWIAQQNLVIPPGLPVQCNNFYGYTTKPPVNTGTYVAPIPAAVHIHGGEVPSVLDGGPDAWWTKNGIFGHGFYSKGGTGDAQAGLATYVYPNVQEAAPVWFHDHMLGATRLNVYAGIAGAYPIIDAASTLQPGLHPLGLSDATWQPDLTTTPPETQDNRPLTDALVPLIIQDRMFDTTGQLYFPNVGLNPEHPYWIPEFVGDTIVVNGKTWPFLNVEPRRYRFLVLNGSNARAYELFNINKLTGVKEPSMWVIGNDQGYLDTAKEVNPLLKANGKLAVMPGERYEIIIDFSKVAGQTIEMWNDARTPYVGGSPVNGNTTGKIVRFNVAAAATMPPGYVDKSFNPAVPATNIPGATGAQVRATLMNRLTVEGGTTPAPGVTIHKTRRLTLNEVIGPGGPLEVLQNNTLYDGTQPLKKNMPARPYNDYTEVAGLTGWNTSYYSELPYEGETELWEIVNITADAHPIHPHLVAFQVLNRQALDVKVYTAAYDLAFNQPNGLALDGWGPPYNYNNSGNIAVDPITGQPVCSTTAPGRFVPQAVPTDPVDPYSGLNPPCVLGGNPDPAAVLALIGAPVPPAPQEVGWKDTVQALPGMVTRFLVRFARPTDAIDAAPTTIGYDFSPNHGHGYVWHCHIVDHEDNEMMRPFTVVENQGLIRTVTQGPGAGQY